MKKVLLISLLACIAINAIAQADSAVYAKFTTHQNRDIFYKNLLSRSITKALSLPLNIDTEDNWANALNAIELINYQQPWINAKIKIAADSIQYRSLDFQQALLEILYAGNRTGYVKQVNNLLNITNDAKIFAMSAEYLLLCDTSKKNIDYLIKAIEKKSKDFSKDKDAAIMQQLTAHAKEFRKKNKYLDKAALTFLFTKNYLKGNVVVYSIQRKNRDYTGIAIVKDTAGKFIVDSTGHIFNVPQLARSLSNMPGYISNGNTPQGIYRLYGFGRSNSFFIGPTQNLQLTMPYETSLQHFLRDSTITDTSWSKKWYSRLLPEKLKNYEPLYQSFYAGMAGRTEIIAHGTTVDPNFYTGKTYYPFTPTAGCLCTKELWDENGKRIFSGQQKLTNAVKQAGGGDGYLIVIEIDDAQKAVTINEVLPFVQ